MRRTIALVFGVVVASLAAQEAERTQVRGHADHASSRPSAAIEKFADLPSGDGFAARYPGDYSIRKDPRTIFSEDFEGHDPFSLWTDCTSTARIVGDDVHSGRFSVAIDADMKADQGGHLLKRLRYGEDTLFVRFYVKFPSPAEYVQHFVQISADRPARSFPLGGAGVCPDGGARFATAIEPFGATGAWPAPGAWHLHTYWCEMAISDDGKYWGNDFNSDDPVPVVPDRWTCVEVMVKANSTAASTDGAQAFWIDGQLAAAFRGYRFRTDPELKLNGIALLYSMTELAARRQGSLDPCQNTRVLFDDLVVARNYIGPQASHHVQPSAQTVGMRTVGMRLEK